MNTLHLFAGAGGGIIADMLLGHTPVGAVEIDKYIPTPNSSGLCGGTGSMKMIEKMNIPQTEKQSMKSGSGGPLNPEWVEWLIGWPIGWTDLKPLETGRFPQ